MTEFWFKFGKGFVAVVVFWFAQSISIHSLSTQSVWKISFFLSIYLFSFYPIFLSFYYLPDHSFFLFIYKNPLSIIYKIFIQFSFMKILSHSFCYLSKLSFTFLLCFDYLSNNSLYLILSKFYLSFITSDIYINVYFIQ